MMRKFRLQFIVILLLMPFIAVGGEQANDVSKPGKIKMAEAAMDQAQIPTDVPEIHPGILAGYLKPEVLYLKCLLFAKANYCSL